MQRLLLCLVLPMAVAWWWEEHVQEKEKDKEEKEEEEKEGEEYYEYFDEIEGVDRLGLGDYYYYYYDDYIEDRTGQSAGLPSSIHPLAALIAPLAGLALMGAAFSVSVNPLLLQLVTLSSSRRRRMLGDELQLKRKVRQLVVLRQFLASLPEQTHPLDSLTAEYLSWSGLTTEHCLDLLACHYASNSSWQPGPHREVVSIVLYNLLNNQAVQPGLKGRLRGAARAGRADSTVCGEYSCSYSEV